MLVGNVVALLSPMIFIPILTFAFGADNYDYKSMLAIRKGDDTDLTDAADVDPELVPGGDRTNASEAEEQAKLLKASKIAKIITGVMTLILLVLWPMPLYGTGYIFSKKFFTGWVSVGIFWLFCSSACVAVWPLIEGRHSMAQTFRGIWRDLTGKGHAVGRRATIITEGDDGSGSDSPVEKIAPQVKTEDKAL
jgi:hypothetical protein